MTVGGGSSSINGVWENTPIVVVGPQIFPHPEVPKMRDHGWRDEHEVSYVRVPSFVRVRFMSSMISCSRIPRGFRVLFPKRMFAVKVACKYDVAPPQT